MNILETSRLITENEAKYFANIITKEEFIALLESIDLNSIHLTNERETSVKNNLKTKIDGLLESLRNA